jgi:hypothetical protein
MIRCNNTTQLDMFSMKCQFAISEKNLMRTKRISVSL